MTLSEQTRTGTFLPSQAIRVDVVSATVDGTERHAVRRVSWTNGNTSGTLTECGRQGRPFSFDSEKPVTCKKCLRYAPFETVA